MVKFRFFTEMLKAERSFPLYRKERNDGIAQLSQNGLVDE